MGYYLIKKLIGFNSKKLPSHVHGAIITGSHKVMENIKTTLAMTIAIIY